MLEQYKDVKCPKCGGLVRQVNEFGVGQCYNCLLVFESRQELEAWTSEPKPRFKRLLIWLKARIRRGKREGQRLASSPRYENALRKLRSKYNILATGCSSNEQARDWQHWFNQQVEEDIKARKRSDRIRANSLRKDCEKIAKKFKVMGGWEIVRRHMLYNTALKDFMFEEGWHIEYQEDGSEKLVILPNATQETMRSAKRLFKQTKHDHLS